MEKYKKFTDAGTGINPFVPFQPKNVRSSALSAALQLARAVFVSPLLAAARFAALAAVAIVCFATRQIGTLRAAADALFGRCALLLLGFWRVDADYMLTSGRRRDTASTAAPGMQSGDLILANHFSYVEVLYLSRFSTVFAAPVLAKRTAGGAATSSDASASRVVRRTFGEHLADVLFQREPLVDVPPSAAVDLRDLLLQAKQQGAGPVVLFPEATTSNGQAILQWQNSLFSPDFDDFVKKNKIRVHVVAFKLEQERFSPAYVVPGLARHLYTLATQFYNSLSVRIIENVLEEQKQQPAKEFDADELRALMAKCFRSRLLQRSLADKLAFMEYWTRTHKPGYVE